MIFPLIFELYVFALCIAFLLAAVNVRFRDIGYLWEVFLQAAFYATPILYLMTKVSDFSVPVAKFLMLSPVTQILQDIRYFVVTNTTITTWSLVHDWKSFIPFIIIIVIGLLAIIYFRRNQARFAEQI